MRSIQLPILSLLTTLVSLVYCQYLAEDLTVNPSAHQAFNVSLGSGSPFLLNFADNDLTVSKKRSGFVDAHR